MTSITTITGRGQITIPSSIRKLLNLQVGNQVVVTSSKESITIKPLTGQTEVLDLFQSITSPTPSTTPEKAISKAKKKKAHKTATQAYE